MERNYQIDDLSSYNREQYCFRWCFPNVLKNLTRFYQNSFLFDKIKCWFYHLRNTPYSIFIKEGNFTQLSCNILQVPFWLSELFICMNLETLKLCQLNIRKYLIAKKKKEKKNYYAQSNSRPNIRFLINWCSIELNIRYVFFTLNCLSVFPPSILVTKIGCYH